MKFFKLSEFDCKCCGQNKMNRRFLFCLDYARERAGVPFIITSGFRCEKAASGKKNHSEGIAADIRAMNSQERFKILEALLDTGFRRIGINKDKKFIHVDQSEIKSQQVIWVY